MKKRARKFSFTAFLLILLIILLLIAAFNISGNLIIIAKNQQALNDKLNQVEMQVKVTQAEYQSTAADQEQRLSTLEDQPTYEPAPVPEIKVEEEKPEKETSFNPLFDPVVPLAGVLATLSGLAKTLLPIGGLR